MRLAKEVRQADLTAGCRHMNFRSKWRAELAVVRPTMLTNSSLLRLERHEVEMTELYKQRCWLKSRVPMSFRLQTSSTRIEIGRELEPHCFNMLQVKSARKFLVAAAIAGCVSDTILLLLQLCLVRRCSVTPSASVSKSLRLPYPCPASMTLTKETSPGSSDTDTVP